MIGVSTGRKNGSNIYKSGKLSSRESFARHRKGKNRTPIIVAACVLVTLILALVLGNILGKRAEHSQTTDPNTSDTESAFKPETDKVSPSLKLNAYFVDMSTASPENSLSEQTGEARARGNALFFDLKYPNGDLLYSSDVAEELGIDCRDNLTLARLANHFQYYNDHAVCRLESDFSSKLDASEKIEVKARELSILLEATEYGFDRVIVSFGEELTREMLTAYQTYIVDLKLACPNTAVGVELSYSVINDTDSAGIVSELLSVADFYMLDLGKANSDELDTMLKPLTYFTERYGGVVMLTDTGDDTLAERIARLENKGMENYIVK